MRLPYFNKTTTTLKKTIYNIHLILGLGSGIIVFIVAITGCLYAFKTEIENVTQSWRDVDIPEDNTFLPPSELKPIAQSVYPDRTLHGIAYGKPGQAAEVLFYEPQPVFYHGIIVNPYNGNIIKVKNYQKDFFQIVFSGHFQLWLPRKIGKPIIAWSVLIFTIVLISGIILWWPKRNEGRKSFTIQWKAPWRRRLYDLHSVLGFYAWIVLFVIAVTGLVWGFQWFSKGLYKLSGGEKKLAFQVPRSDLAAIQLNNATNAIDYVWHKMKQEYPEAATIEVHFPHDEYESIYAHVNPSESTHWKTEYRYFDRYTLKEIEMDDHVWGKLGDASTADKIRRLNYDVHTGAIAGLPGKILAFFASLIAASLPVTGFLTWWRKRKEKKKLKEGLGI